jgi:hypothetical protein
MNRMHVSAVALIATMTLAGTDAQTQRRPQGRGELPPRAEMQERMQERVSAVMRNRLDLSDEQVVKLQAANQQLQADRMAVRAEELRVRSALRAELLARDSMSERRVEELLNRWMQMERRRVEFMESEQKALAEFLSPSQRARFMSMQDEIRRGMEAMRDRRDGGVERPRMNRPAGARPGDPARGPRPPRLPMRDR